MVYAFKFMNSIVFNGGHGAIGGGIVEHRYAGVGKGVSST